MRGADELAAAAKAGVEMGAAGDVGWCVFIMHDGLRLDVKDVEEVDEVEDRGSERLPVQEGVVAGLGPENPMLGETPRSARNDG